MGRAELKKIGENTRVKERGRGSYEINISRFI